MNTPGAGVGGSGWDRLFRTSWTPGQQPLAHPKTKAKEETCPVLFPTQAGAGPLQRGPRYYLGTFFCSSPSDFPRSVTITGLSKQLRLRPIEQGRVAVSTSLILFVLFGFTLFWLLEGSAQPLCVQLVFSAPALEGVCSLHPTGLPEGLSHAALLAVRFWVLSSVLSPAFN